MKKLIYILPMIILALTSCGGDNAGKEDSANAENPEMTGVVTDLATYGWNYSITLPDKKNVQTEINATDWGSVDIRQGDMFVMSIAFGEGDLDLIKFDLEEDLIYKSQILEESENHIVYKREIEDSGMEPEFHFMYVIKLSGEAIEIQNSKDFTFNEEAIRNMLASARSFKAKEAS